MKKENPVKSRPTQEQRLLDDAGKVGASMVHISFAAAKLFARMAVVAFRASKLIVDYTLRSAKKQDRHQPAK